ncbi:MAG: hypothetical protein ABJB66_05930 [Gemmatimonadaceae bacterium]
MNNTAIEALVRCITILFVLSLAVERIAEIFKARNWQPLSLGSGRPSVDLRTGVGSISKETKAKSDPDTSRKEKKVAFDQNALRMTSDETRRIERTTHAANTAFIGMALAGLTGANAFSGLAMSGDSVGRFGSVWTVAQILVTGAAAGIGSSFWYDLLRLVTEMRRAREVIAAPALSISPVIKTGINQPPIAMVKAYESQIKAGSNEPPYLMDTQGDLLLVGGKHVKEDEHA